MSYEINTLYEWINPNTNQKETLGKFKSQKFISVGGHGSIVNMIFIKKNGEENLIKYLIAQGLAPVVISKVELTNNNDEIFKDMPPLIPIY